MEYFLCDSCYSFVPFVNLDIKQCLLTLSVLPERPAIVPSLGSATVVMFTSPLPVVSMMSMIFGFPSVVT